MSRLCPDGFTDISMETIRTYTFPHGDQIIIENPYSLKVSDSGGHRIIDSKGQGHYVNKGWLHIEWSVDSESPIFVT